jgi:serine/threonine protein kinase
MQGDDDSEDSFSDEEPAERQKIRELLRTLGKTARLDEMLNKRKKEFAISSLRQGDEFEGYIVCGITEGCKRRLKQKNNDGTPKKPTFLVRDAIHIKTEQERVLKYVNPDKLATHPGLERFLQNEYNVLSRLNHPNIVQVYTPLSRGKMTYLPFEQLPFGIESIILPGDNLEGLAFFLLEASNAMRYLKSRGVVHGDIHPEQFRGGHDPYDEEHIRLKILDFAGAVHPEIPYQGTSSYTPQFAAPEVRQNVNGNGAPKREILTHKSDMYSVGITCAWMALVRKMLDSEILDLLQNEGNGTEDRATRITQALYDHHLPYMFNRIVESLTMPRPEDRIDADELAERAKEFCFFFDLGPKVRKVKDLYTGKVMGIEVERPF